MMGGIDIRLWSRHQSKGRIQANTQKLFPPKGHFPPLLLFTDFLRATAILFSPGLIPHHSPLARHASHLHRTSHPCHKTNVEYDSSKCVQRKLAVTVENRRGWAVGFTLKVPFEVSRQKTDAQTGGREAVTLAVKRKKAPRPQQAVEFF
jgi:hypothetical protein